VATSPESDVVQFLVSQTGHEAQTVSFGTEAPQLTALGAQTVVFGAGDIKVAHQSYEFVPIVELTRACEILGTAIRRYCT
jgi:acetylornithine deacetylase